MAKGNLPVIKVTELEQAGYVVRDCEKSMESMWKNFGIGPWRVTDVAIDFTESQTYYGKPARFGFKAACTVNKIGGFEIELIEPTGGDSIYRDFLKEKGEGLHHLGWHKVNTLEAYKQTAKALEQAGFPCIMSGSSAGLAYGYFDTSKSLHTLLEVIWLDPSKATPPPVIREYPEAKK